jgi:membrane protease YdiL (CAAX protease family)
LDSASSRAILLIETGVVIALAVLPSIDVSIRLFNDPLHRASYTIYQNFASTLQHTVTVTIPALFIMWRSGSPWDSFGIVRIKWVRDSLLTIGAYAGSILLIWGVMWGIYLSVPSGAYRFIGHGWNIGSNFRGPQQQSDYLLLPVLCCLIGFREELIFRGYLINRFERIFNSTFAAVIFSSLLFGFMHLYQGWYGVISTASLGLVYAIFFARFRRLWPLVAAHAVTDFIGFIRIH